MKNYVAIATLCLLLTACETNQEDKQAIKTQVKSDVQTAGSNVERHTTRVAGNVRDQVKKTAMKLREWWLTPLPNPPTPPVPPSYCYRVLQDVTCYREPVPALGTTLVGWQGDGAPPPPAVQTEPLPSIGSIVKKENSMSPNSRLASAKPVFVTEPKKVKADDTPILDNTPEPGSEPLPDPALSPQL